MAKLADALDLGSSGEIHGGSSPSIPTNSICNDSDDLRHMNSRANATRRSARWGLDEDWTDAIYELLQRAKKGFKRIKNARWCNMCKIQIFNMPEL